MAKRGLYGNAVAYEKPAGKKTTIGGKKKRYNKSSLNKHKRRRLGI
jgi:hypothetical protein